ncbi:MAG TPA: type 1 glutamine amidotransferase domain-containing protein [Arenimonas sp.]
MKTSSWSRTIRLATLVLLSSLAFGSPAMAAEKRVLMLVSSNGTEARPELSYDLEELAQSYLVLNDNGVGLDIASPRGGAVLVKDNRDSLAYIRRFKALADGQLENTIASADVDLGRYDGIFIVGGSGAMIDLPSHGPTQRLLGEAAAGHQVIAAVCHGPAAIADIRLPDGEYFVSGKRVTGFSNVEERAFSAEHLDAFPFMLEDRLAANGATFGHNAPMLPHVAVDGRLITAQNPGAVAKAAEAMVLALGLPLQERPPFADERTLMLISQARQVGAVAIDLALATPDHGIDMDYLALYGFYAYRLADEADKPRELDLALVIGGHFSHPEFDAQLIANTFEQGWEAQARTLYERFVERFPGHARTAELAALLDRRE